MRSRRGLAADPRPRSVPPLTHASLRWVLERGVAPYCFSAASRWPARCAQLLPLSCDHRLIQTFIVTIEGPGWKDLQDIELPRLPEEGDPIETKYGVCLVTHVERTPGIERYDGTIVCRFS